MLIFPELWKQKSKRVTDWTAIVCSRQRLTDELFSKATAVPGIATFVLRRLQKSFSSCEGTHVSVVIALILRSGP